MINKEVLKREYTIRIDDDYIIKIDNLLTQLNDLLNKQNSIETNLSIFLNTLGLIHLYQPFIDGNTRTLFIYFLDILEKHNYKTIDNNYREYITLFFYEYEYCT